MTQNYESEIRQVIMNMDQRLTRLESNEERRFNPRDGLVNGLIARVEKLEGPKFNEDRWLDRPAGIEGQQVRYRKIFPAEPGHKAIRKGELEFTIILAETRELVIIETFSEDGSMSYGEKVYRVSEFDATFERREA